MADELWEMTDHHYCFVELANLHAEHKKGDTRNYDKCPYLLRAWESEANWQKAMELARTAECCVFSGVQALPFQKERMKLGLLSFDMSERWLKQGIKNLFSPAISKMFMAYWLGGWRNKPLYKLCCSAFAKSDHERLGMYKDKCYKWGYFTKVGDSDGSMRQNCSCNVSNTSKAIKSNKSALGRPLEIKPAEPALAIESVNEVRLLWCARYLEWKHPEFPVLIALRLKDNGYKFHLSMYGEGELRKEIEQKVDNLKLRDVISFTNKVPNHIIRQTMSVSDIFLFTSDKNEGWGAVANEAMSEECLLLAADEIGAVPYIVKDGVNGLIFKSKSIDSLYDKVVWAIEHPRERKQMQVNARKIMLKIWSPFNAAKSLLKLINDLSNGMDTSIKEGPCTKA